LTEAGADRLPAHLLARKADIEAHRFVLRAHLAQSLVERDVLSVDTLPVRNGAGRRRQERLDRLRVALGAEADSG
jgi:hypothetical protein